MPGARLIQADLIGTGLFVITAGAAAALLRPSVQAPAVAVSGALFVGGCLSFAWGFLLAVERSRTEAIELSSLFFLKESAPPVARRALLGLLTVQVIAAIVTASVRPFTSLAFGVLAPLWGLGIVTLWSGRYGAFAQKALSTQGRPRGGVDATEKTDEAGKADEIDSSRPPHDSTTEQDRPE